MSGSERNYKRIRTKLKSYTKPAIKSMERGESAILADKIRVWDNREQIERAKRE